jgi:DNA invertase Pin-like site-specific DNA recombinase
MNILLYARVSTEDQTLQPQWIELDAWAARNDATVVDRFSDVLSGGRAARPGIDALRERCRAGGVDCVCVAKLDRLGRSLLNVVRLVEELDALGVAVICTSQGIDTRKDSPCGRMILQIMAAFSEFEKAVIVERTVAGLVAARARGKVLGRPSPVLVEDWQPVVAAWRAEGGRGLRELARRLGGVSVSTAARLAKTAPVAEPVE